ncbi:MAG TPA: hypothetical protein VGO78_12555, partial [Acidimicrobiales bacterium]|nr:hypothetical protein [Acidimicrobiales bacterium]
VTRRRDPENRRAHLVEMTEEGRTLFTHLLGEVVEFDARLRAGFTAEEIERLQGYLDRILANVANVANVAPAPAASSAAPPAASTTEGLIP